MYVIRSDGKQLYGKSGSLSGNDLPNMLAAALQQSGRSISEEEFTLLEKCNVAADAAVKESDWVAAAVAMQPVAKIGVLTKLNSFAEPAIRADELATKIQEEVGKLIQTNESALDVTATELGSLVNLYEIKTTFGHFPVVAERMNGLFQIIKKNKRLKDSIKPAQVIARARTMVVSEKRADKKKAEKSLANLMVRYAGSAAADFAEKELTGLNPDAVAEALKLVAEKNSDGKNPDDHAAKEKTSPSFRKWSDDSGSFSVRAQLVKIDGDQVHLKTESGEILKVDISKISGSDRDYLRDNARDKN